MLRPCRLVERERPRKRRRWDQAYLRSFPSSSLASFYRRSRRDEGRRRPRGGEELEAHVAVSRTRKNSVLPAGVAAAAGGRAGGAPGPCRKYTETATCAWAAGIGGLRVSVGGAIVAGGQKGPCPVVARTMGPVLSFLKKWARAFHHGILTRAPGISCGTGWCTDFCGQ